MTQVSFHSTQDVLVDVTVINDRHMTQLSFHRTQDVLVDVTTIKDRSCPCRIYCSGLYT